MSDEEPTDERASARAPSTSEPNDGDAAPTASGAEGTPAEAVDTDDTTMTETDTDTDTETHTETGAGTDDETDTDTETETAETSERVRRALNYLLLAGLAIFALVAAVGFYTAATSAISTWVTTEYQPLVRAAFNLVVLLVVGAAILRQARRLG